MADPIRVRFAGQIISATPLQKLPNGNWQMASCVKQPRFDVGHLIEITPAEFVDKAPEGIDALDA